MLDLLDVVRLDGPIKYECVGTDGTAGIRMVAHRTPVSITQQEADIISLAVAERNVQRGYELATAFGVSATAIGLALRQTGGKLVTMDAYVEEQINEPWYYYGENRVNLASDGYQSACYLLRTFGLNKVVTPKIGWSPSDVERIVKSVHGEDKLDFVFLDAFHSDEALLKDYLAIEPFIADRFVMFVHDIHCFSPETLAVVGRKGSWHNFNTAYGLAMVSNNG